MAAEEREECRICFGGAEAGPLTAPCQCRGTQRLVHAACLARWQRTQLRAGDRAGAARCSVCRAPLAGGVPALPLLERAAAWLQTWAKVLLALGTSALLLPPRITALFVAAFVACRLSGVWPAITVAGLALIRQGAPVPDLRAGVLLVATLRIPEHSPFARSVVLVLDASEARGAYGVVVNHCAPGEGEGEGEGAPWSRGRGGPVRAPPLFVHGQQGVGRGVVPGVRVSGAPDGLDAQARVIQLAGAAAWGPRQLEGEIRAGSWRRADCTPALLFETAPGRMWESAWGVSGGFAI